MMIARDLSKLFIRQLVHVCQTLFSGTVAENIGYMDLTTKINMQRVELAAQTANADEFIRTLPQGYETCIGPGGSSLSGGQRQRLGLYLVYAADM